MPYTKTVTLNEQQDEYLQSELQQLKNTADIPWEEQTSSVAQQILTILETAPVSNVT